MEVYIQDFLRSPTSYLGYLILVINLIIYSLHLKYKTIAFKCIHLFLLLTTLTQVLSRVLPRSFNQTNLHLSHYYFIGQFVILSVFFYSLLKNKKTRIIIKSIASVTLIILTIQYITFPELYHKFNELEIIITSLPLLAYCFLFFMKKLNSSSTKYLYFVSAFFLYTLCNTLLFLSGNLSSQYKAYLIEINRYMYLIFVIFPFVEWYKNFRKSKTNKINNTFFDKTP